MRILVAEDERPLASAIVKILEKSNYSAEAVYNGEDALAYIREGSYDALLLDIMMPGIDGLEVLHRLRRDGDPIPVLLLTARSEIEDRVIGLDSGANDYLTKPFDARELLARIRAMTRTGNVPSTTLSFGNITLDRASFALSSPTGSLRLANKEFQMMELLLSNPARVVSTERFIEKIWGYDTEAEINVVWVYISYLRKKLTSLGANIHIKASRNAGYSLEEIK